LVAAGYVVLATEHADFPPHGNHWKRSLDVTFILTEFLKTSLGKTIDQQRIGFAGYSLGGMTGISLAGAKIQNLDAFVPDENPRKIEAYL
jgi:predicted dienelactone hydrolase